MHPLTTYFIGIVMGILIGMSAVINPEYCKSLSRDQLIKEGINND